MSEAEINEGMALRSSRPSATGLPPVVTKAVQPWIDGTEAAMPGMGLDVMRIAADAFISLQQHVMMTPDLEGVIAQARLASDNLGISLNQDDSDHTRSRAEALAALDAMIEKLREARLNE